MKKLLNNKIFTFFLGCILTGGISVFAAAINASDIKYTPKESTWNVTNAEAAINDLYDYSRKDTLDKLSLISTDNVSYGSALTNRSVSLTLEKGEYLVIGSYLISFWNPQSQSSYNNLNLLGGLSYTNGTCNQISGKMVKVSGTEVLSSNYSNYITTHDFTYVFKCKFDDTSTITFSRADNGYKTTPQSSYINAIKLN